MSFTTLALVLVGAICHALWNVVAKRAAGGAVFVWLFGSVSLVAIAPVALWTWHTQPQAFSGWMWAAALASGLVHVVYSLVLQQGYRTSDFAVVYPVARGSGPMLSVIGAIIFLHEMPGLLGWIGVLCVLFGLFMTVGAGKVLRSSDAPRRRAGVLWGLLVGLCIASYTVLDGIAIKSLAISPVLFYTVGLAFRTALLAPWMWGKTSVIKQQWQMHGFAICAVGLLSPLAYSLILFALQQAPLSYIAPVREISMLFGVLLGARLLKEAISLSQLVGAALMLFGVLFLAFA